MFFMTLMSIVLPAQETPVFRAGVSLVKVDAQVTDRAGHPLTDLTAADFEVLDDGQPQKIAFFGQESEPLDLVLLLDVSGSMHRHLEELAQTARAALRPLTAGDRVALMLFAREAAMRVPLTADFARIERRLRDAAGEHGLGSGTAINSAIISAAQYAGKQPVRGRRAILIVTDNLSLNYQVPDEKVIRELYAADAVFNAILIGKQKRPSEPRPGAYVNPDFTPSDVFKLAAATGGQAVEARKAAESFQAMIERIRARYALGYTSPGGAPGAFHRIEVQVKGRPGAVVRARAGYFGAG
jgi:Ca-activated chloride channel family protein